MFLILVAFFFGIRLAAIVLAAVAGFLAVVAVVTVASNALLLLFR